MTKQPIEDGSSLTSARAPEPVGPYPHLRRAGNLLFLSGMGPRQCGSDSIPGVRLDQDGRIADYDIEVQCRATFDNLRMILEEAGSSWDRIVDVTVFLTDIAADFATFNRVYAEYFTTNQPTRTTIQVSRLPTPIAVELKVIAQV